ncbi:MULTISPECIES: hypothetical protein [Rhizobium]|uniref:hypothetical protein n=1 Tax=Rhizobium TaxID=379 RepID=UPI001C923273|nr:MULTISPECIES: hypothetical protein [Rhizobium]MBY3255563.1 hypothetical protein [Rhizobium laguerreae]MBY3282602.1 hypothetical protein [Rhizobium laguerreae]MBY3288956.1 hypothetical protein [Rhizobium laguerreae]MBY5585292.1 hypothetical protein [Rhizobium leguminosarum]
MIECIETKNGKKVVHLVDPSQVDQLDEISGDEQHALVWCETHRAWEWHWIERSELGGH